MAANSRTVGTAKGWATHVARLFVLSAAVAAGGALSGADLDAALIQTTGEPALGTGRFYGYRTAAEGPGPTAFADARDLARAGNVPLVLVWGDKSCAHCAAFTAELNRRKDEVAAWLGTTRAVFAYFKDDTGGPDPTPASPYRACYAAWAFAKGTCRAQPTWPLFAFWYVRPDGTVVTWGSADDWTGATRTFDNLRAAYAAWTEENGIGNVHGGRFAATGTGTDRYEAQASTPFVEVELVRDGVDVAYAATNRLEAVWPVGVLQEGEAPEAVEVAWAPGEAERRVAVDLAQGTRTAFPVGGRIALRLLDADGAVAETNAVHFVADEVSARCPLWKTERTAETLDFGEWTADYDAATNKVAQTDGAAYTLVNVQGSLWCPDCVRTEANFLDLADETGQNRFSAWAKARQVALVAADIPHFNGPDVTNRSGATLFTREAYMADGSGRSGRAYLSRKAISDEDAQAALTAFHRLASANTAQGGFHRPEDRNANRTGVPIFVLVRKDGTVAGRFTRFAAVSPTEADRGHFGAYVRRIEELIARDGEAAEIENNHWSSTPQRLAAGAAERGSLCQSDAADVFRLAGVAEGALVRLSLAGPSDGTARRATLAVTAVSGGAGQTVATTAGDMAGLALDVELAAADAWFATVGHDDEAEGFKVASAASTVAAYTLACDIVLVPGAAARTVVPPGGTALLRVAAGGRYRIAGIAPPAGNLEAVPGVEGLYRASADGDVRLVLAEGHGEIAYQLWTPGRIHFASGAERVIEYAGTGTVAVVRMGGASGEARVTVRRAVGEDDGGRVAWADQELVWADGEDGRREVGFAVRADETPQGETALTLNLEAGAPCAADLGEPAACTVTVVDTDAPCLERLAYDVDALKGFATELPLRLINVRDGDTAIRISRVRGSAAPPAGMRIRYDAARGVAVLDGVPTRPGTYVFTCTVTARRDGAAATGFETTVRIVVRDPSEGNAFLGVRRPAQRIDLETDVEGVRCAAGYLDFAVTSVGRLSARYTGADARRRPSFAGNWQAQDADGTARAALVARTGETLDVAMDAAGGVAITLAVPDGGCVFAGAHILTARADWPGTDAARHAPFKGQYNVALEAAEEGDAGGYLALKMATTAAVRKGRVQYAGVLPDGTAVSGTTTLGALASDGAEIAVFARAARNVLGAILHLDADGASKWESAEAVPGEDRLARELVTAAPGAAAYVLPRTVAGAGEPSFYGVYGSYFEPRVSPLRLDAFYGDATRFAPGGLYALAFGVPEGTAPEGAVEARDAAFACARTAGLSFSYSRQTGAFRGAARVRRADGRTVTGTYRGLVVPGWVLPCECGLVAPEKPFGTGVLLLRGAGGTSTTAPVTFDRLRN